MAGLGLIDEWLQFRWRSDPVEATFAGFHDYDTALGDYGPDHLEERRSKGADFLSRLRRMTDEKLMSTDSIDRRLAIAELESENYLLEHASPWARDASVYPELCLAGLFLPLVRGYAPLEERAGSIVSRLGEIPKVLNQARASLRSPVKLFAEIALEIVAGGKLFITRALPMLGDQVPAVKTDLEAAIRRAVEALDRYHAHLEHAVLPSADTRFALGRELFDFLLRTKHLLPYDSDDLVGIGEESMAATLDAMKRLAAQHGRGGQWVDWVEEAKGNHPDAVSLKGAYERAMREARAFVIDKALVTVPRGESLEVIWTPEFERSQIPYAAYMPPAPLETQQKGLFYVTPVDEGMSAAEQERCLRGSSYAGIPVTALHEGYPGHHLQISLANRHPSVLRRVTWSSLFGEGWALYCEDLMYEQGFYSSPVSRLMQLKDLLWRSVRVVLDARMHRGELSFDDAVEMLVSRAKLEVPNARAEAKRYARTPTQPMSYLVGKLLIQDILSRYRRARRGDFKLREFHDRLLSHGNMPPSLVGEELFTEEQP